MITNKFIGTLTLCLISLIIKLYADDPTNPIHNSQDGIIKRQVVNIGQGQFNGNKFFGKREIIDANKRQVVNIGQGFFSGNRFYGKRRLTRAARGGGGGTVNIGSGSFTGNSFYGKKKRQVVNIGQGFFSGNRFYGKKRDIVNSTGDQQIELEYKRETKNNSTTIATTTEWNPLAASGFNEGMNFFNQQMDLFKKPIETNITSTGANMDHECLKAGNKSCYIHTGNFNNSIIFG